ncbi:MAG TPA: type II secretion system F family protein [Acidimicrobiales bacterium]|nr:type II secretion system F family protein [Acidimicrobiales bacterium]
MIVPLLLGALVGLGAIVSWRLLFPSPPPLQAAIDRLQRRNPLVRITHADQSDGISNFLGRTVGASLGRIMRNLGLRIDSLEPDLRLVGRTLDQHLAQKVVLAFFGFALPAIVATVWTVGGFSVPLTFPTGVGLVLGVFFFFAPDISLRSETEERRKAFKQALGSFLDLVVISLAGGTGVESALRDAAAVGRGWAFAQLRNALEVTALTGETPWAALARLGEELGVTELVELSASVSLAGTEGARVRDSLAVKAASLRDHALAEAEAEAQSTTEKMALPVVLLFLGFLILIGYPAVDAVVNNL